MGRISPSLVDSVREPLARRLKKSIKLFFWKLGRTLGPLRRIYARNFHVSTVPAADILASPHSTPFRKVVWVIICIPLIYLTLVDLNSVMTEYTKYPVIYTYEYMTNNTLTFPDVTICNINPFLKSRFCDRSGPAWTQPNADSTTADPGNQDGDEKTASIWTAFCGDERFTPLCNYYCGYSDEPVRNKGRLEHQLTQWIKKMAALGNATQKLLYGMGHSIAKTVDTCSYASNTTCGDNNVVEDYFNPDINQIYGPCFCFHCQEKQHPDYYDYGTLSSPLNGLVITLNTELEEYLGHSREVGFVAIIHEHGKKYSLGSDAVYVPPGYTTFVGLEMYQSSNMEKPYENPCIRDWPDMFKPETSVIDEGIKSRLYRREDCLSYCLVSIALSECACIPNDISVKVNGRMVEDYKYCSGSQKMKCYQDLKGQFGRHQLEKKCGCLQECVLQSYRRDVSIAGFVPRRTNASNADSLDHSMSQARLVVYFHSFTYEHVRALPKYTAIRILGTIGAINGMYFGLSFYILFQAMDIIVFSTYDYVRTRWRRKKARSEKKIAAIQVGSADLRSTNRQAVAGYGGSQANGAGLRGRLDQRDRTEQQRYFVQPSNRYPTDQLTPPYTTNFDVNFKNV